jgi:hypothetical protein
MTVVHDPAAAALPAKRSRRSPTAPHGILKPALSWPVVATSRDAPQAAPRGPLREDQGFTLSGFLPDAVGVPTAHTGR